MPIFIITYLDLDTGKIITEEVLGNMFAPGAIDSTMREHNGRIHIMSIHDLNECANNHFIHGIPFPPEIGRFFFEEEENVDSSENTEQNNENDSDELDSSDDWKKLI